MVLWAFSNPVVVPRTVATIIRALAALGTLGLALRLTRPDSRASLALGVLLLSGCYLTLFGPRNEYLSYFMLTMPLAGLALLMLARDAADYRCWLLIAAALVLGFDLGWEQSLNSTVKPAIVVAISIWLAWLMIVPQRWRDLVEGRLAGVARPG